MAPTPRGKATIPTLDEFVSCRGVDITEIGQYCDWYEIYAQTDTIADPIAFSPKGWKGEFIMLGMSEFSLLDMRRRVGWLSELLTSRFGKDLEGLLVVEKEAFPSLIETWEHYALALNIINIACPGKKSLIRKLNELINSIDISLARQGEWEKFGYLVKSVDQKILKILEEQFEIYFEPLERRKRMHSISWEEYLDKVEGGWLGQCIGVTYGETTEFKWQGSIMPFDLDY